MNNIELKEKLNLNVLVEGDEDIAVTGCYIGDLLSWVMGRAKSGDAWLTVMGNINAIGVASLADVACIILTENAALDENAKIRAKQQGIWVFSSELNSYEIAIKLNGILS